MSYARLEEDTVPDEWMLREMYIGFKRQWESYRGFWMIIIIGWYSEDIAKPILIRDKDIAHAFWQNTKHLKLPMLKAKIGTLDIEVRH